MENWQIAQGILRTTVQILAAGIAITAFSLLLYALTFNLRHQVARTFALIMMFVMICFTGEVMGTLSADNLSLETWLRLQWVGIVFIPAAYLHFSIALLMITGKPIGRLVHFLVFMGYLVSSLYAVGLLISPWMFGQLVVDQLPAPHLKPTLFTEIFALFFAAMVVVASGYYYSAYRRTKTSSSRRRMRILAVGGIAPLLGSFPFLLFSSDFAGRHTLIFWSIAILVNILVGVLLVVMAYGVAFFGVPWPDRMVKSRLFKWILRGPVTASAALAATTIIRRGSEFLGIPYSSLVPITMVGTVLLFEYLITLFARLGENVLFLGNDLQEVKKLRRFEERLLTRHDLRQFLEMITAAVCDQLQAPGAYVAAISPDGIQLVIETGKPSQSINEITENLLEVTSESSRDLFRWGNDYLVPLHEGGDEMELIGLLGVVDLPADIDPVQIRAIKLLSQRAAMALRDRQIQQQVFRVLDDMSRENDIIGQMRASSSLDGSHLLHDGEAESSGDISQWVKEALSHYWGGPKFTGSPLMRLKVVVDAADGSEGNYSNALRSILKKAIETTRPDGDRRFTGEWILYNILEMKFLEGKKVREVALRLAMSEADLYRKQRVAIDAVARAILEMESDTKTETNA